MFCGKCGTKNADNATFCAGCGAKINVNQSAKSGTAITVSANNKERKIGIIAVAFIVVAIAVLVFVVFGGRSYKATIDQFFDATFEADAEIIFEELIPEAAIDYLLEEEGYDRDDLDEQIDEVNEEFQDQIDTIDDYLGDDWEVSYKILSDENLDGEELEDLKENYEDMDVKVSAAKTVEIEVQLKAGDTENSNTMDLSVIKVGRSWYLDVATLSSLY